MTDNNSKLCSDFLRETYPGLKASHARELVAAFFGYNTHAALLAEANYQVDRLEDADLLIPDINLMDRRRQSLNGLPEELSASKWLAEEIAYYLRDKELFCGETWIYEDNLATYILEEFLPNKVAGDLDDYLADVLAETNAYFDDPYYDSTKIEDGLDSITVSVPGKYFGEHDTGKDRMFCGDTIDMEIVLVLKRVAGRVAFVEPDINVSGHVNRDYMDPDYDDDMPAA